MPDADNQQQLEEQFLDEHALEAAARVLARGNEEWQSLVEPSDDFWQEFVPEARAAITAYLSAVASAEVAAIGSLVKAAKRVQRGEPGAFLELAGALDGVLADTPVFRRLAAFERAVNPLVEVPNA